LAQQQLERQLRAGIRAAQQGDADRARELLEGVLRQQRTNELAWIWMASIVKTQKERRLCLQRVLQINPNNRPAREAINNMVSVIGEGQEIDYAEIARAARQQLGQAGGGSRGGAAGGGSRLFLMVLLAVGLGLALVATIVLPRVLTPPPTVTPTPTETLVAEVTEDVTPRPPTATSDRPQSIQGAVVTRAPGTAFPTNTPTITPTPTETPLPTATLPPISDYGIFIVTGAEGQIATFYRVAGDGSSQQRLFDNLFEADVLPNTRQIAFTRSAEGASDDENAPTGQQAQAFITTIDDPANADQVSRIPNGNIEDVALSPDGSQMVYVSTQDGDAELVLVNLQTGIARQLTNNTASDTDPDWSPDGTTLLFTSDQTSVGRHDIYRLNLADESVSLVLDTNGIATNPRWSPDMTQIVYADARANDSNVYVVTADGSRTRQLSNRSGALFITPNWTPDGRYVVYVAQVNEGADQIVFVTPGGRDEQVITFSDTPDILQVIVR
jgi:hypothetical protein